MDGYRKVLDIDGVSHAFGRHHVLHDINLLVERGEIIGLVGPSGCGKSTLLRAIVGTHPPRRGRVLIYSGQGGAEACVVDCPGRDRGIVYQQYSLFPFLTALENVAFGLMLDRTRLAYRVFAYPSWRRMRKQHLEEAHAYLDKVGLGGSDHLYPSEMSGGMRQRVAVAQALIMRPEILLLDEPFGALDEAMREELQRVLLSLYAENVEAGSRGEVPPYTIFIVTHELNEALYVGSRVIGLSQYWDWQGEGHAAHPGATLVYDKAAPIFRPDEEPDLPALRPLREEIRDVVFSPASKYPLQLHRTFTNGEVHA